MMKGWERARRLGNAEKTCILRVHGFQSQKSSLIKVPCVFHPALDFKTLGHSLKCFSHIASSLLADNKLILLRSLDDPDTNIEMPQDEEIGGGKSDNPPAEQTRIFDLILSLLFDPIMQNISPLEIQKN